MKHRLIIISGPSCVGKTPLFHTLESFYPQLLERVKPLVLYNSREPRPKEKEGEDYYFRPREDIESLKDNDDYLVLEPRGDLVAVHLKKLVQDLQKSDMLYEGNSFVATALLSHPHLKGFPKLSVFVSPLSKEEIHFLQSQEHASVEKILTDIQRRKLLRRNQKQKGLLSVKDLQNIEVRAASAFEELKHAHQFQHVIVNHDGEDHDNWEAFHYPLGDARRTLLAMAELLEKEKSSRTERWDKELLEGINANKKEK